MIEWQPIKTAPKEAPLLLARFHPETDELLWACMAAYQTFTPGYIHCASYSGWVPGLPTIITDPTKSKGETYMDGIIGTMYPPTHWAEL